MSFTPILERVRAELAALGSPQGILSARRFFKEPIDPYGVSAAHVRRIAVELSREIKAWTPAQRNRLATAFMKSPKLEEAALAAYLLGRFHKQCARCEFLLMESWLDRYVSNWAHTDSICTLPLAAAIHNDPTLAPLLLPWTTSTNRWKRRAAAVALVKSAGRGRLTELIFQVATPLMTDPDVMVQKGVGWLLKENYDSHPEATVRFLETHKHSTSRLTLRYAAEKMTPAHREKVLR